MSRFPALQRFVNRLMAWPRGSPPFPALAVAGMDAGPLARSAPAAFEMPDFSIVFAVPKSKRSKARIRMRRFYQRPENGTNWEMCPTCNKHRRLHYYCLDCFKDEGPRPGSGAQGGGKVEGEQ